MATKVAISCGDVVAAVGQRGGSVEPTILHGIVELMKRGWILEAAHEPSVLGRLIFQQEQQGRIWGQLRPATMADIDVEQLRSAPTSDCERCELRCCAFEVRLGQAELERFAEGAQARGLETTDLVQASFQTAQGRMYSLEHQEDGTCILLDDSGHCKMHSEETPGPKPLSCTLYPGIVHKSPSGASLGLRPGCCWPGTTDDPAAVQGFRSLVRAMALESPHIVGTQAPEQVQVTMNRQLPWSEWSSLEGAAIDRATEEERGRDWLLGLIDDLADPEGLKRGDSTMTTQTIAGALAGLMEDRGKAKEAEVLYRMAAAEKAFEPWKLSAARVSVAVGAWFPLRFATALGGLGVLRLLVAAIERDPEVQHRPAETTARWFRLLNEQVFRDAIAASSPATLEALALAPSLP